MLLISECKLNLFINISLDFDHKEFVHDYIWDSKFLMNLERRDDSLVVKLMVKIYRIRCLY